MTKIPAVIFILVGAGVAGFSYFMDYMQGKNSFIIFMIAGIGLFLYGIGKLIFRKKDNTDMHDTHLHTGRHAQASQQQMQQSNQPRPQKYSFCPFCGSILQPGYRFCYNCGSRLRD
jgi:flagellar basal body-associated protein FliL